MSKEVRQFKVLVASPGDTADEREIVKKVIDHVNRDHGEIGGFSLTPVMWETDAAPGVGIDAQDVINQQLGGYDMFIGLLSARFGTPTKRASSGTEEEFGIAFERYLKDSRKISILFYFRNAHVRVHDIPALVQALHVAQFKIHLEQLGVFYQQYDTVDDLAHRLRGDLPKRIRALLEGTSAPQKPPFQIRSNTRQVKAFSIGDWVGATGKRYPQGASYRNINLLEYPQDGDASIRTVKGLFQSDSTYFRFGFKLLPLNAKPFGEGSIQTDGSNLLVHLAKDHKDGALYVTAYQNGHRTDPFHKEVCPYRGERELPITLIIAHDGAIQLQIDDLPVWESYVSAAIQDRVLIAAWGDYFDYQVSFRQIRIEVAQS
jgi:hypothetical protein